MVLRRKSSKTKKFNELKGSSTPLDIKNYFYEKIKNIDFSLYAVILDKKKSYKSLWDDKERIYTHISHLLLEEIKLEGKRPRILLTIDRSKSKDNIRAFDQYILYQLKGKLDPVTPLDIVHRDSHVNYCLQAVDLFCWGIYKKYEDNNVEWYKMFEDRVKCEKLLAL
jgi:hypothetical protein